MIYDRTFQHLADQLRSQISNKDLDKVELAYEVAERAHAGQTRDEGTAYIVHPVRVALVLTDELQNYSPRLICSALLHDVIEDSNTTRMEIATMFGEEIAEIVWLLTKFEDVPLRDYLAAIEAASDTGAALVKVCDRLDNLRFVSHSSRLDKKRRYIRTTEAYYLPLASRTNDYLYQELDSALERARDHMKDIGAWQG